MTGPDNVGAKRRTGGNDKGCAEVAVAIRRVGGDPGAGVRIGVPRDRDRHVRQPVSPGCDDRVAVLSRIGIQVELRIRDVKCRFVEVRGAVVGRERGCRTIYVARKDRVVSGSCVDWDGDVDINETVTARIILAELLFAAESRVPEDDHLWAEGGTGAESAATDVERRPSVSNVRGQRDRVCRCYWVETSRQDHRERHRRDGTQCRKEAAPRRTPGTVVASASVNAGRSTPRPRASRRRARQTCGAWRLVVRLVSGYAIHRCGRDEAAPTSARESAMDPSIHPYSPLARHAQSAGGAMVTRGEARGKSAIWCSRFSRSDAASCRAGSAEGSRRSGE